MALDNGYQVGAQALPTPTDTPYDTPSRGLSAQSSRQASSSPYSTYSSGAPLPAGEVSFFQEQAMSDTNDDDFYNSRDSRRLTPNLGISFVSQIHTLKKDLEARDALISSLEESLNETKVENEQLNDDLKSQRAEVKSVKQQMSSLEHDMLQALEDVAKERDKTTESVAETRKYLDASKKKAHMLEDEVDKANLGWEKEKQEWENNTRRLENKVHVVEERLKTMVAEVMDVRSMGYNRPGADCETDDGTQAKTVAATDDDRAASCLSNMSTDDHNETREATNFRASRMSALHEMGGSQMSGLSLADELDMTQDDRFDEGDMQEIYSPDALPEEYGSGIKRYSEDQKARKVMGFLVNSSEPLGEDDNPGQHATDIVEDYINLPGRRHSFAYVDRGTQPTNISPKEEDSTTEKHKEQSERSANSSRKRVAIPPLVEERTATPKAETREEALMVSRCCQTDEDSYSVADKPAAAVVRETKCMSTQTLEEPRKEVPSAGTRLSPMPLDVPVIAIHPPTSRPPSSHTSVVLPPRTRNAECQVSIQLPRNTASKAIQTDIQRDLVATTSNDPMHPITIATKQSNDKQAHSFEASKFESANGTLRKSSLHSSDDLNKSQASVLNKRTINNRGVVPKTTSKPTLPRFGDSQLNIIDRGTLNNNLDRNQSALQQPQIVRSAPSRENFDIVRQDNTVDTDIDSIEDDEFKHIEPIRKTLKKEQDSWKLVSHAEDANPKPSLPASVPAEDTRPLASSRGKHSRPTNPSQKSSKSFQSKVFEKGPKSSSAPKPADIRRQALVSNGIAGHVHRARSPSMPSASGQDQPTIAPPFPVPTRSSSRKIPLSASEGAASPTPNTRSFFSTRENTHGRPSGKRTILRKVQSATAVPKAPKRRPPPPPPSMSALTRPERPRSPSVPRDNSITTSDLVTYRWQNTTPGSQISVHAGQASIQTPIQQVPVVEAIRETMVGGWMWKYVRKRTSFGITESPQAEFELGQNAETGNSNVPRHKRWIWLAPYDRAVLWSTKQPMTDTALMGKGARKLVVKSVLDVKDDTPLPKNAGSQTAFNRSLLLLTPQRALKLTAVSQKSHFVWLTALIYVTHATSGFDDFTRLPPIPHQEPPRPSSKEANGSLRRAPVRDSIRVAKDRARPSIGAHSFSSPINGLEQQITRGNNGTWDGEDEEVDSGDAAEPPQVPRRAAHTRKRSNTGPLPVPLSSFHSYPANSSAMESSSSLQAPTTRDKYDRYIPRSRGASSSGPPTAQTTMTARTTDPSRDSYIAPPPVVPDNFFDPAGTMRMEAFVRSADENEAPVRAKAEAPKAKKESRSYRTRQGRKKDLGYWGVAEPKTGSRAAGGERMGDEDPFTGF